MGHECHFCRKPLKGRQSRFCCDEHKNRWWAQKKSEESEEFKKIIKRLDYLESLAHQHE